MKKSNHFSRIIFAFFFFAVSACTSKQDEKLNISFEKYTMPNGLQIVLHEDHSDPVIAYDIMYHVGSGREIPGRTGFAHLFEHLLFMGSENVPNGAFDHILESMGGSNNGGTSKDITTYYEIFPKNALEKVLWLESDRMGFFINSVTPKGMAIQQNVVQNEKRQRNDNAPYGHTDYVISKNLYPKGHPYNWTVIGEMEDLKNATLDDVKTFYNNFYGPNNATLVLAGDFNSDSVKILLNKYFGEIKSHGSVETRSANIPVLEKDAKLYHEDNFANVPELTMVWPAPQNYQKDTYALDFLANLLSEGKKAPMYKVLVKEKQLTSNASAYNNSQELSGEFTISIRANEGKNLKEIENAVFEAFDRFEKEGITDRDVERVKASMENGFYNRIASVSGKSMQLAYYNTLMNDPGYIVKDIENIKAVTKEDIKAVYEKYIKGKPHVVTSFVPKGQTSMMAENSIPAGVSEEDINNATQVKIAESSDNEIVKSPSTIDRTIEPPAGKDPEVKVPAIWKAQLANGIQLFGIENKELPIVQVRVSIDGGLRQDRIDLPGVGNMVANVLPQGTVNKTPEELEEEIQLLGSEINVSLGSEEMNMQVASLSRNFDKTIKLLTEIVLEPRWDSTEFTIARTRNRNRIIQSEAQPRSIATLLFNKLLYGPQNIFSLRSAGTRESIDKIKIDDLKAFYEKNFSPSLTRIHIAGNITKEQALKAFEKLGNEWKSKDVLINNYPASAGPEKSAVYFYDMPGSGQSVIIIGYLALARNNPDYPKADFVNYRLGGNFSSILNQILREQKGFTYGASSYFQELRNVAPFIASSSVRSDATSEALLIFKNEMDKYRQGISEEDLQFIKNSMIRSNALRFETNYSLTDMLSTMSKYNFPEDYIKKEEEVMKSMTVEEHKAIAQKYLNPEKMYYVVVGDAASRLKQVEKTGLGVPVLVTAKTIDTIKR